VKLYVCWTTKDPHLRPGGHPCANAHKALQAAGHDPDVVHTLSFGALPHALQTSGRKLVKEKTGTHWVPALETDEGGWITGSSEIAAWAERNPAAA
jgi:hypothetical protein